MNFIKTEIDGVIIVEPRVFKDDRGYFFESYSQKEFAANGIENSISHKRGVISMARAYDMDSASSQFFIVQTDSDFLDGQYAGFGYVTEGMDVVDKICADSSPVDNNGTITKDAQPVITSVTVSENPNYVAPVEVEEDVEA